MNFSDTLKYQDSLIVFKNHLITIQKDSIAAKDAVLDSLNAFIIKNGAHVIDAGTSEWYKLKFLHIMHQVRILMFTEESLVLLVSCSIMGFVIVSIDLACFKAVGDDDRGKLSILSLKYSSGRAIFLNYLLWGIGAGLVAYLTTALGIFKCNFNSSAIIAITWPVIFPKLVTKLNKSVANEVDQKTT